MCFLIPQVGSRRLETPNLQTKPAIKMILTSQFLQVMMQDLEKWHPYNREKHSSSDFFPFKFCLRFQSLAHKDMHLVWTMSGLAHQHRKQWDEHSGIHNLSHKHTPVAASLQVTSDRSKQHHVPYMVGKQCQPPMKFQVDDSRDSVGKVPLVHGQRKDTSRYKKGVIGPPRREFPFPGHLVENYIVI
jgi:hypothetical protein